MRIALIGCGFLGSWWAEFAAKRLFAAGREAEFVTVDRDVWEQRNAANQNVTFSDIGKDKSHTIAMLFREYEFSAHSYRADILHIKNSLARQAFEADIFIDALDNLVARHFVWEQAMRTGTPVMHLGINEHATGMVEWTLPKLGWQGWHLNPLTSHADSEETEQPKHPPCHLVQTLPLGINVAWAGATALTLAMGEDIEERFGQGPQLGYNVYTQWAATMHSIEIDKENLYVSAEREEEG